MKIKRSLLLLLTFLLSLVLFDFGSGSWVVNSPINVDEEVTLNPAGGIIENYKVSGGKEESAPYAKFVTLEGAIKSANSILTNGNGVNIYLTPNSYISVVNQNLTLNPGVTLFLPYEGKKYDISSDDELTNIGKTFVDTDSDGVKKYNVSNFAFEDSSLTISSGAKVIIGGIFQETGVSGYYSQITLDQNSSIIVEGELICNGYIKEKDAKYIDQEDDYLSTDRINNECDGKRYVLVKDGGMLKAPIAFYDAGGSMGSLTGLNNANVFPISVFDFPCLQTYVRIDAGGKFLTVGRMVRSSGSATVPVNETIQIVKGTSDSGTALITLSTGYVSFEYCPLTPGFTQKDESKTYLIINGEASLGYMSISIKNNGVTSKISTEDKYLPFSYKLQIFIGSKGSFSTNSYKMKFLPGSRLKILKGGQFNLNSSLIAYKTNSLSNLSISYPNEMADAVVICDGDFIMGSDSTLGAHFSTTSNDGTALIDLSKVSQGSLNASSPESMSATLVSVYSTGDFLDDDGESITQYLLKAGTQIKSDSQGNKCWQGDGSLISYTLSITVSNPKKYANPVVGYQVYKYDSSGNETLLSTKDLFESESKSYILGKGESYKVISLDRAENTSFTKQHNSNYSFTSGSKYAIKGDTEITISAGEGILIRCEVSNASGAGGAVHKVYEKTSGNFNLIDMFNGPTNFKEISIKKGATIKYWVKLGNQNFLQYSTGDHYLLNGIVDKTSATSEKDLSGTKLTTKTENSGKYSEVSNVQSESTIHQLIVKKDSGGGCFAKGTRILTSDGTYQKIENLKVGDNIKSFNHETGKVENQFITYIPYHSKNIYQVLELHFENQKKIKVLFAHGFMNAFTKKYEEISVDNVEEKLGDSYLFLENGAFKKEKMISYSLYEEETECYSLSTAYNLNHFVEGALCISDDIGGLYNYFELDDNYKYDDKKKQADIDRYGLLKYEDVAYFMSREIYEYFNVKYLSVSIGKGMITMKEMEDYVSKFA